MPTEYLKKKLRENDWPIYIYLSLFGGLGFFLESALKKDSEYKREPETLLTFHLSPELSSKYLHARF